MDLLQIKGRFIFTLQILSTGNFDLTEIISRDHIVEIRKQLKMVRKFPKNQKTQGPVRPFKSGEAEKIW